MNKEQTARVTFNMGGQGVGRLKSAARIGTQGSWLAGCWVSLHEPWVYPGLSDNCSLDPHPTTPSSPQENQ